MGTEYGSSDIRNIAVLGHGGSGKTTLVDAIAYIAGSTTRRGSVESGTTHTDFTPEEHDHGISINLAVARAEWMGTKINLVDTPGYLDFFGEVEAGVRVVDGGLIVVSATGGVEVGTERVWAACARRSLPRVLFVSMMDRENANFEQCFQQIRDTLSREAIPVEVPIGAGDHFEGIVNLFSNKAHMYKAGSTKGEYQETEVPGELLDTVEQYREQLIETIAATDDDLLDEQAGGADAVAGGHRQFHGRGQEGRARRARADRLRDPHRDGVQDHAGTARRGAHVFPCVFGDGQERHDRIQPGPLGYGAPFAHRHPGRPRPR
jgi:elongation factor G